MPRGRAGHLVAIQDSRRTGGERNCNERIRERPAAVVTAAPEAAPRIAPEAEPAKDAQPPSGRNCPRRGYSVPPAPAEKPAGNSIDAKLDILNAVTTLVKALSQKAQEPVQPPADADPGRDDGVDGLLAGITKAVTG